MRRGSQHNGWIKTNRRGEGEFGAEASLSPIRGECHNEGIFDQRIIGRLRFEKVPGNVAKGFVI